MYKNLVLGLDEQLIGHNFYHVIIDILLVPIVTVSF